MIVGFFVDIGCFFLYILVIYDDEYVNILNGIVFCVLINVVIICNIGILCLVLMDDVWNCIFVMDWVFIDLFMDVYVLLVNN